jgi:hypothetical protein
MMESPFSPEFVDWAQLASYTLKLEHDAWVLDDSDGVREYVRYTDGFWILTNQSRNDPESFLMQAAEAVDIERFLTSEYGAYIRLRRRLRMIDGTGVTPEGMSPRYGLVAVAWAKVAVIDERGETRAILLGNMKTSAYNANEFSWIADASLEDLRASYLDPGGLPLFPGCKMIQPTQL